MSDLILHHYPNSPFSEKVRLILGYKGLAWRSVLIPTILPKPDVVALTGGYRKTPFMQVGADVYCDTALIARLLEQRQPAPSVFPASAPLAPQFAQWADSVLFWCAIPWVMQPAGVAALFDNPSPEQMKAFATDRAGFTAGMRRMAPADAIAQLHTHLAALNAQVRRGSRFLLGDEPSIADFAVAHSLWFIRLAGPVAQILAPHTALTAWLDRVLAFGHGSSEALDSGEAVAIAARSTGHAPTAVQPGLGFDPGQAVTVAALDYGSDPVAGTLVGLSGDEVVIERHDERAGLVHVHFPRIGFQIKKESKA